MSSDQVTRLEDLLQHAGWLRQLAANLVGSGHDADDVVQEVWRATLAAQPEQVRQPRAWLAAAVRNVIGMGLRSGGRRQRREQDREAQRPVEAPSAAELVAEQDLRRDLIARVDRLPPEERDVVLLRFWQDQPPREVAKRLGIPVNTVRSRTARALERLRGELDRERGGRRAWCLLLVPLLDESALRAAGAVPGVGGAKVVSAVAAALLLGVGGYAIYAELTAWDPIDLSRSTPASEALARFAAAPIGAAAPVADAAAERTVASPDATARAFAGQVVDLDGRPIAGATLHRETDDWFETWVRNDKIVAADWQAITDRDGAFVFGPEAFGFLPPRSTLRIGGPRHADFVAEREWTDWPLGQPARIEMRRAFDATLDIEVVEKGSGLPVPWFGVEVTGKWGRSSSPDPDVGIAPDAQLRCLRREFDGGSGFSADGRLRETVRLVAGADNHLRITVNGTPGIDEELPVPTMHGTTIHRRYELDFEASAKVAANVVRRGLVLDAVTGRPVVGARLQLADAERRDDPTSLSLVTGLTREDGAFCLGHDPARRAGQLSVRHPEYLWQVFDAPAIGESPTLRLLPFARLTAQFVSRGQPVAGLFVLVRCSDTHAASGYRRLVTDRDGRIALTRLPAENVALFVTPHADDPDEHAIDSFNVRLQPGDDRSVQFEFQPPNRVDVQGAVLHGRDVTVPLVPVLVPLEGEHGWIQARALGGSGYLAGGVRRGRYLVLLTPFADEHRDGPFALAGVVTIDGAITQVVDVTLPEGRAVGRVLGLGADVDRAALRVVAVPVLPQRSLAATQLLDSARLSHLLGAPIDEFGLFDVRRVPDGPCELQLRRGGEVLARKTAQVLGGGVDVGDWDVTGAERR